MFIRHLNRYLFYCSVLALLIASGCEHIARYPKSNADFNNQSDSIDAGIDFQLDSDSTLVIPTALKQTLILDSDNYDVLTSVVPVQLSATSVGLILGGIYDSNTVTKLIYNGDKIASIGATNQNQEGLLIKIDESGSLTYLSIGGEKDDEVNAIALKKITQVTDDSKIQFAVTGRVGGSTVSLGVQEWDVDHFNNGTHTCFLSTYDWNDLSLIREKVEGCGSVGKEGNRGSNVFSTEDGRWLLCGQIGNSFDGQDGFWSIFKEIEASGILGFEETDVFYSNQVSDAADATPLVIEARYAAMNASGEIYTTGYYHGNMHFSVDDVEQNQFFITGPETISAGFFAKTDQSTGIDYDKIAAIHWDSEQKGNAKGEFFVFDRDQDIYLAGMKKISDIFYPYNSQTGNITKYDHEMKNVFFEEDSPAGLYRQGEAISLNAGDLIKKIIIDEQENIYALGSFSSTLDLLGYKLEPKGERDIFVFKVDKTLRKLSWLVRIGGTDDDEGFDLARDAQGRIYVTGMFTSNAEIYKCIRKGDDDYCLGDRMDTLSTNVLNPTGFMIAFDEPAN